MSKTNAEVSDDIHSFVEVKAEGGRKSKTGCGCQQLRPHWGWVVVCASFMAYVIFAGFAHSFGLYYLEWVDYFEESNSSEISWIGSILLGVICLLCPVGAILAERFGDRAMVMVGSVLAFVGLVVSAYVSNIYLLLVFFGIVTGFGMSIICMIGATVPIYYFDERHVGLAVGIATSGNGCGSFLMPLVTERLILTYGWRGSLLICSGIVLNICVCGALMRKPPIKDRLDVEGGGQMTKRRAPLLNVAVFKDVSLILFLFSQLAFAQGLSTVYVHVAALVEKATNVSRIQSAAVISTLGLLNCIGRIGHGAIAGIKSVDVFSQYGVCCIINAASLFILPNVQSYPVSILLVAIFGFCIAPYGVLLQVIVQKVFGIDNLKLIYGALVSFSGIGWITGAPIAGLLYDVTGNYGTSMYFGGAAMIGCVFLYFKTWLGGGCHRKSFTPVAKYVVDQE